MLCGLLTNILSGICGTLTRGGLGLSEGLAPSLNLLHSCLIHIFM